MYDECMQKSPATISDLISRWPTIGEFASAIGVGYEAARQMRYRGRIAPEHWASVIRAARKAGVPGVSIEWLADQRATPSKSQSNEGREVA